MMAKRCSGRKPFVPTQFGQLSIRAAGASLGDHFVLYQADAELLNAKLIGNYGLVVWRGETDLPTARILNMYANNRLQPVSDDFTLLMRRFSSGQQSAIFEIDNELATVALFRIFPRGQVRITPDADTNALVVAPSSDANLADILEITNAAVSATLFSIDSTGRMKIDKGVTQGAGMKHQRVTAPDLATGATQVTAINWTTAFPDANYTIVYSVQVSNVGLPSGPTHYIEGAPTASGVNVRIANATGFTLTGITIDAVALHD